MVYFDHFVLEHHRPVEAFVYALKYLSKLKKKKWPTLSSIQN